MCSYRIYIDESGDHTYRNLHNPDSWYLGLTGLVIRKSDYNPGIPHALEALKRGVFAYDPDNPPILVRKLIINRKSAFGVLRDSGINARWEAQILDFYRQLPAQIFTVVIDKKKHLERYPTDAWNPYDYSLEVLLTRIRGWLNRKNATADVMPESRGRNEDNQLLKSYIDLRTSGSFYRTAADFSRAYPLGTLLFRKKEHNVAGLQLADLVAAEQKLLTIQENDLPAPRPISTFGQKLNSIIQPKINPYGRYLFSVEMEWGRRNLPHSTLALTGHPLIRL